MTRSFVLLPSLFVVGCGVGEYGMTMQTTDGQNSTDDRDICVPKVATPSQAHDHVLAGANPAGPRSGLGCMAAAGCHGPQPGSSVFTAAGTAYKEAGGTTLVAGATVRFYMPGTKKSIAKAITDTAGNFYVTTPLTFPSTGLEVDITGCGSTPDIVPMISPVRANEANCQSSAACHAIPGTRAIFLP